MTDKSVSLPNTLEECHALIKTLAATIEQQQDVIDREQETLQSLQRHLDLLKRSMFGHRRERFEDPDQQLLFDSLALFDDADTKKTEPDATGDQDDPNDSDGPAPKGKRSGGRSRRVFPEFLPREQRFRELEESDIPEDLRTTPGRRFMKKVGEWLEYKPPELRVIEEFVETLAIDNEDETETTMVSASREDRILQSFAGPSLLASIAANRFADHLPYYRLEEILGRVGISIDRATQSRWMIALSKKLLPLVTLMRELVLQSPIVQADETPVKMLVPGQGQASTAYLWALLGDQQRPYTTFYFTEDRSRAGPDRFFADFEGTLLSDAYIGYESLGAHSASRIALAGCHAHARRKFEELHVLGATERTSTAMGFFQRLFDLEDELKPLSDEERHAQRQLRARPLMDEFKTWLDDQLTSLRPKHELRGAIEYMTKRWESFTRFLDSGAIPIHNNATEQAVKVAVMGKKAWLFFGAPSGGEAAAIFYSLTATCRRLQIDPEAYLRDVFERLPNCDGTRASLTPLLPDRWLAAHPESKLQMRELESSSKAARKRALRTRRRKALAKKNGS